MTYDDSDSWMERLLRELDAPSAPSTLKETTKLRAEPMAAVAASYDARWTDGR